MIGTAFTDTPDIYLATIQPVRQASIVKAIPVFSKGEIS
jgi:hypothetical protein